LNCHIRNKRINRQTPRKQVLFGAGNNDPDTNLYVPPDKCERRVQNYKIIPMMFMFRTHRPDRLLSSLI